MNLRHVVLLCALLSSALCVQACCGCPPSTVVVVVTPHGADVSSGHGGGPGAVCGNMSCKRPVGSNSCVKTFCGMGQDGRPDCEFTVYQGPDYVRCLCVPGATRVCTSGQTSTCFAVKDDDFATTWTPC